MDERLKFHLTLTNNETGEVIHDGDINAFIGAIADKTHTTSIAKTSCNTRDLVVTILGAEDAIEHAKQGPGRDLLELMITMTKAAHGMNKEENKED